MRVQIASRGYLAFDDFTFASRAAGSHLSQGFLFRLSNNHLMPGGMLVTWLVTRATGLAYWPYIVLLTAMQALVDVAFYRLLRSMLRPGWGLLVPLTVFLFSPLTLEATSWWAVGVNVLPMQLAMVLAIGAQVRYIRTRNTRHLVTLGLSLVLGLLFFEKSLLIVPLVYLVTACLYANGGPLRSLWQAARGYWQSWAVLAGVTAGYLGFYVNRSGAAVHRPNSASEAATFLRELVGSNFVPGLIGGPWRWLSAGDGAPVSAPTDVPRWLSWAVFAVFVIGTVYFRRSALRAWTLLGGYLLIVAALLAMTRLGLFFSAAAGLAPRYISDAVVVAALCVGVALVGLVDRPDETVAPLPARVPVSVMVAVALTLLLLSAGWSSARFGDEWASKKGRDYLRTAMADLAKAPPGTVFLDRALPENVQSSLAYPDNLQSRFFGPVRHGPVFVDAAENPSMFDDTGHIRRAHVEGTGIQPGPDPACGYPVSDASTVRIPLTMPVFEWRWVVRIGYLGSERSPVVFSLGRSVYHFEAHREVHQLYFVISGGGDSVQLTVLDPTVRLCVKEITVGQLVPQA
jgi:hypothetical protein